MTKQTTDQTRINRIREALEKRMATAYNLIITWVDIDLVEFDTAYQTEYRNKQKSSLTAIWDPRLCAPITLSYRNGHLYCIDGYHRCVAAMANGMTSLLASVFTDLTQAEEAKIFADQHDAIAKLKTWDVFNANLVAGEKTDTAINDICKAHGFTVRAYNTKANESEQIISSITSCRRIMKTKALYEHGSSGKDCLNWILDILCDINWHVYKHATSDAYIGAFAQVFVDATIGNLRDKNGKKVDVEKAKTNLETVLRNFDNDQVFTFARANNPTSRVDKRSFIKVALLEIARGSVTANDILARTFFSPEERVEIEQRIKSFKAKAGIAA